MPRFEVTTVENVFETYTVEAETAEQAESMVLDNETRANLPSGPSGDNADLEIVGVNPV